MVTVNCKSVLRCSHSLTRHFTAWAPSAHCLKSDGQQNVAFSAMHRQHGQSLAMVSNRCTCMKAIIEPHLSDRRGQEMAAVGLLAVSLWPGPLQDMLLSLTLLLA